MPSQVFLILQKPPSIGDESARFSIFSGHQTPEKVNGHCLVQEMPTGQNQIGKFLSTAARNAGLHGRLTNHSVRKTCISRLLESDVPENYVAQLSGHNNLKSLDSYKTASIQHQRRMSLALSRSASATTTEAADTTWLQPPSQVVSSGAVTKDIESAVFQNCSFTIQVTHMAPRSEPARKYRRIIQSDEEED